jgi:RimJ/RimL family protein N-acetyltransferase
LTIALLPASIEHLAVLVSGKTPHQVVAARDALPPTRVPQRTLSQLAAGKSPSWCCLFYMVHQGTGEVLGTCGFKDEPRNGKVEVGYGVAPEHRGNGYATAALAQMVSLASGLDRSVVVLAQVNPANLASTRVVQKLGFVPSATVVDEDDETLVQWLSRSDA